MLEANRELHEIINFKSMIFPALFTRHCILSSLSLAVIILLLLNTGGMLHRGFVNRLENFTYDVCLNLMIVSKFTKGELKLYRETLKLYRPQSWDGVFTFQTR